MFVPILLAFLNFTSYSQEAVLSTGSDIEREEGSISFSIGQLVFNQQNASKHSKIQGVQQAYEISISTLTESTCKALNLSVFPNPTSSEVTISTDDVREGLFAQLFDSAGRLVDAQKMLNPQTIFQFGELAATTYFIKITQNDNFIQTFKVVKQ